MDIKSFNLRQKHEIDLLEQVINELQSNPVGCDIDINDLIKMRDRMIIAYDNYRQLLSV